MRWFTHLSETGLDEAYELEVGGALDASYDLNAVLDDAGRYAREMPRGEVETGTFGDPDDGFPSDVFFDLTYAAQLDPGFQAAWNLGNAGYHRV